MILSRHATPDSEALRTSFQKLQGKVHTMRQMGVPAHEIKSRAATFVDGTLISKPHNDPTAVSEFKRRAKKFVKDHTITA